MAKREKWRPFGPASIPPEVAAKLPSHPKVAYINNHYLAMVFSESNPHVPGGQMIHLVIRAVKASAAKTWTDYQRVKREILGPDVEGVELYPSSSRDMDLPFDCHMWCLTKGRHFPFGFIPSDYVKEPDDADGE